MMIVEIFLICVLFIAHSIEINNGLGRTPQMGKDTIHIVLFYQHKDKNIN